MVSFFTGTARAGRPAPRAGFDPGRRVLPLDDIPDENCSCRRVDLGAEGVGVLPLLIPRGINKFNVVSLRSFASSTLRLPLPWQRATLVDQTGQLGSTQTHQRVH